MSFSSSPFSLVGKEGKELFKEDYFIYLRKWKVSFSQPLLLDCCSHKPSWQRLSSDYPFIAESPNIHTWNLRFICKSGDDSPTHQRLFPCWKETQNVHGSVLEFYPFSVCVCVRTERERQRTFLSTIRQMWHLWFLANRSQHQILDQFVILIVFFNSIKGVHN